MAENKPFNDFFESPVGAGIGVLVFVVGLVWYLMSSDNLTIIRRPATFLNLPGVLYQQPQCLIRQMCSNGWLETPWGMSGCCGDLPKPRSSNISMARSWSDGRACWSFLGLEPSCTGTLGMKSLAMNTRASTICRLQWSPLHNELSHGASGPA